MAILSLNAMLVILNQPYSSQLLGTNQVRLTMVLGLIMLGLNILLNLVLIPQHLFGIPLAGLGGKGASWSLVISSFAGAAMFRYFAFRTSQTRPDYKILIHLVLAIISFGACYLVYRNLWMNKWGVVVYFCAGTGIFLLLMAMVRQFTRDDIRYYMGMISPVKMKNYIVDEMKNQPK